MRLALFNIVMDDACIQCAVRHCNGAIISIHINASEITIKCAVLNFSVLIETKGSIVTAIMESAIFNDNFAFGSILASTKAVPTGNVTVSENQCAVYIREVNTIDICFDLTVFKYCFAINGTAIDCVGSVILCCIESTVVKSGICQSCFVANDTIPSLSLS